MRRRRRVRSFTLVEAMVALTVVGIAVAAILTPITAAIDQKTRSMKQTVAVVLAEQLVEECQAHTRWSYDEWAVLGPSGDEPWRTVYDERSDYHNVTETAGKFGPLFGPVLAASEFPNLTRSYRLQTLYLSGERTMYPPDFMMLTVRVYDGKEELVTLRRLISNASHAYP